MSPESARAGLSPAMTYVAQNAEHSCATPLIMVSTMPAHIELSDAVEQALLKQLGERMARARQVRGLSASALATMLGLSRNTLKAAETGQPCVTMGTYVRILGALGLVQDLALVASNAAQPMDSVALRHARLEAEVASGQRDARSLVAVPAEMAREAHVTFPKNAFGEAQAW